MSDKDPATIEQFDVHVAYFEQPLPVCLPMGVPTTVKQRERTFTYSLGRAIIGQKRALSVCWIPINGSSASDVGLPYLMETKIASTMSRELVAIYELSHQPFGDFQLMLKEKK